MELLKRNYQKIAPSNGFQARLTKKNLALLLIVILIMGLMVVKVPELFNKLFGPKMQHAVAATVPGFEKSLIIDEANNKQAHTILIKGAGDAPDYKYQFTDKGVRLLVDQGSGFEQLFDDLSIQTDYLKDKDWLPHDLKVTTEGKDTLSGFQKIKQDKKTILKKTYSTLEEGTSETLEEIWTIPDSTDDFLEKGPKVEFKMSSNHQALWRMKWIYSGIKEVTKDQLNILDSDNWPIRTKSYAGGLFKIDVNDFDNLQTSPNHTFSELAGGKVEVQFYPQGKSGERQIDPTVATANIASAWLHNKQRNVFFNGNNFFVFYHKNSTSLFAKAASTVAGLASASEQTALSGLMVSGSEWDIFMADDSKFDIAYFSSATNVKVQTCTISGTTIDCTTLAASSAITTLTSGANKVSLTRTPSADRIWVYVDDNGSLDGYSADVTGNSDGVTSWSQDCANNSVAINQLTVLAFSGSDKTLPILTTDRGGTAADGPESRTSTRGAGLCTGAIEFGKGAGAEVATKFGNGYRISDTDFRFVYVDISGTTKLVEAKYDGASTWTTTTDIDTGGGQTNPALFYDRTGDKAYVFYVDSSNNIQRYDKSTATTYSTAWANKTDVDAGEADANSLPVTQMVEAPNASDRTVPRQLVWGYRNAESTNYDVVVGSLEIAAATAKTVNLNYKFDDAQGATAQDASTNNLDGTVSDTTNWRAEDMCVLGKCLYFDGANNDNVTKADDANLDFGSSDSFMVGAWVKRNGASSAINYIVSKADTTTGGYKLWMDADGDFCFGIDDDATWGPDISACSSNANFDNDKWHQVTGVRNNSDDKVYIYVDGKLLDSQTDPTTATLANTNALYVGVDRDGTSNEWLGFIDEVKISEGAYTAAEVIAEANLGGTVLGVNAQNLGGALSNGLVGYWKMDETSAWTGDCSTTSVTDSSGNGKNGKSCPGPASGVTTLSAGKFGNAPDFDGTSQYLDVASPSLPTTDFTYSTWVYLDDNTDETIFFASPGDGTNEIQIRVASQLSVLLNNAAVLSGGSTITASTWHQIVVTRSGSTVTSYLDGVFNSTGTDGTALSFGSCQLLIGVDGDATCNTSLGNYLDGKIDEVRVYNRALSNSEVSQLYNFAPGPVGYWKLEEKSGSTAFDSSSNANDLTWTNTPTSTRGKYGTAINLAGSDQHLLRADDSDFDFGTAASFTYQAWIKHTATPATVEDVMIKYDATAGNGGWELQMETDGDLTCGIDDDEASFPEAFAASTAATYDDNLWHHVACVKDGTSTLALYIDGVLITSTSISGVTGDFANADPLYIGIDYDGTGGDWLGQIDEPKIYNYARTAKQIIEDMNAGHPAPGSPVGSAGGYWKFDEGADNRCSGGANDFCNSGSNGTATDGSNAGSVTRTSSGKFGQAITTDGIATYATIPDVNGVTDFDTNDNFSISFWFKFGAGNVDGDAIVEKWAGSNGYWAFRTNGTTSIAFRRYDGTDTVASTSPIVISSGWHHVVGVANEIDDKIYLYIDGALVDSDAQTTIDATTLNTSAVYIGSRGGTGQFWSGNVDELKIYNFALTADQVKQDFNRSSAQILGALSSGSSNTDPANAASQEYCVPGGVEASCASPVGRWDLEEKTGSIAYDTSATGNDLTWTNTPTSTRGKVGMGINLAGSNQHLVRADDSDFDFGTGSFTLETYIKHSATPGTREMIFAKYVAGDGEPGGYKVYMETDGDITCAIDDDGTNIPGSAPDDAATSTAATYDDSLWHHIACVKNGSTSLSLYIDGVLVASDTSILATGTLSNISNFFVGIEVDGTTLDWVGQLDQVKVYNYARSASQVAWDYNRGGPVGHWKMDECTGTTLNDSAGNSLTGTWSGSTAPNTSTGSCSVVDTATAWYNGATGKRNYSLDFDGVDDQVSVTNADKIDFDTTLAPASSFAAWIYADTDGETDLGHVFSKDAGAPSQTYIRVAGEAGGRVNVEAGMDLATADATVSVSSAIATGTWNHVVMTYTDDGDDEISLYINGFLRGTSTDGNGVPTTTDTSNLIIGNQNAATDRTFDGKIDDFRVYNYELTATQVKNLMNDGATRFGPVTGAP